MTYQEYISQFPIYETQKKAQAKGYEAHHIEPRALQKEGTLDDRCVRLTPFQHIYAHYLLALENPDAIKVFFLMINRNHFKLSDIDRVTIEELKDIAELREKGREAVSKSMTGKHIPDEVRKRISNSVSIKQKGRITSEETKKKIGLANKGKVRSEETRKKISEAGKGRPAWNKGKSWTEETRKKIGEAGKGRKSKYKGIPRTDEVKKKLSESHKGKRLSEETKEKVRQDRLRCSFEYRNNNPQNLSWQDFSKEYKKRQSA